MRWGLFGGSFDPIHWGHLGPVVEARQRLRLERVTFLPTARPPHKLEHRLAPACARFAMVELALLDLEGCFASDFEMNPQEFSYTVDTIHHFRRQQPDVEWVLLIGADSLARFHRWRRWEEILDLVEIGVLSRDGWNLEELRSELPQALQRRIETGRIVFADNPILRLEDGSPLSSTHLRRIFSHGEKVPPGATPDLVQRYIEKYALYR